jgi:hypothetical protein
LRSEFGKPNGLAYKSVYGRNVVFDRFGDDIYALHRSEPLDTVT